MKGVASLFSSEVREALRERLDIVLSDEADYTEGELAELYDKITDDFPYSYGEDGEPGHLGRIFEKVIDVFIENELIKRNK